ncbi:hypothetical protein DIQ79_23880 [Mycolicibacterium smegmatis]|uniref:Uncharacterized protein n=1 Tax=Mycolicibacterium smegmatis (strain ATCC 700084 / mc(2)155) TaxID=246196 RepID=A0R0J6_MYCS2|nr:hypothetical protein MSMEG_4409 [Mycolicibacterium smegmatis MC2 155]TBM40404.1 hypothetical protein DIQ86_26020 [Mycolicibacterium smegmatis]TBH33080.1 hypothetical protein EYS45_22590 [Mycolicibacterium smegmatis MC2 155]TBM48417.1 hypothetical protein DIQ85_23890 [Mycolicibacterium smegmatis]TBM58101.1 hypothetical protein DIQ83_23295 [Mycolicibacterium smegmatis]
MSSPDSTFTRVIIRGWDTDLVQILALSGTSRTSSSPMRDDA